jgi:hypothetical protein
MARRVLELRPQKRPQLPGFSRPHRIGISVAWWASVKAARVHKLPVLLTLMASALSACSEADHPPPIGRGGGVGDPGPIIVEYGGTSNAGNGGRPQADDPGDDPGVDTFAGSSNVAGDSSFGGTRDTSFGGSSDTSFGGSSDTSFGGSSAFAGTTSSSSFGGSFSTGGF